MTIRILILSVAAITLFACTNNDAQHTNREKSNPPVEQTSDRNNAASNNEIATHLANIASEVPDVDGAAAVVAGPYAVVGIDVDEKLERQRVGTIKFSVSEALRDDPYGKTAVVVADADTTERIRNMRDQMQDGEPIQGVVDELAEIVGRFMPTFPVEEQTNEEIDEEGGTISDDGEINDNMKEQNDKYHENE